MSTSKLIIAAALALAGAAAIAHPGGPWGAPGGGPCAAQGGQYGTMMGPRGDPQARQEYRLQQRQRHFGIADADGDGVLTQSEAAGAMPGLAYSFELIDADKNGKVTLEEFNAAHDSGKMGGPRHRAWAPQQPKAE